MLNVKSSHNYRDKQRKRQEHYNLEVGITYKGRLCYSLLLICAPGTSLSAGGPGSLLGAKAPAGSPQALTPAGVSHLEHKSS
jgi:hypothetical protein